MKILKLLFLFLFFTSCGSIDVARDYDTEVDFNQFQSYEFYPDLITGLSALDEDRLLISLERELKEKGLSIASQPDLYVNVYTEEYQESSRNRLGVGVGGGGGNLGVGISGNIPIGGPEFYLQITIDLIQVENDQLVWQAVVNSKFNRNASPELRQEQFYKIVRKAFEEYPPKK